jgi:hypothetical protein
MKKWKKNFKTGASFFKEIKYLRTFIKKILMLVIYTQKAPSADYTAGYGSK